MGAGGIAFKMGGCKIFGASLNLYINGRGVLTPILRRPPTLPTLTFFRFCPPPPLPCHLQPLPTVLSIVLFLWLNG